MENKTTNKTKLFSFLLVFAVLFTGSCKKENEIDNENLSGTSKNNLNNVLNISKAQFEQLRSNYKKNKSIYANQYGTIKSLANATALMEPNAVNYEMAVDEMVSDDLLTSIINPSGEIIVDNNLYRITPFGTFQTTPENQAKLDMLINEINQEYPVSDLTLDNPIYDLTDFYENPNQVASAEGIITLKDGIGFTPTFSKDQMVLQKPDPVDVFYGVDPGTVEPFDYSNYYNGVPTNNANLGGPPKAPWWLPNPNPLYNPSIIDEKDLPSAGTNPFVHPLFNDANMGTQNMTNPDGDFWKTLFKNSTKYNYFNGSYRTSVLFYNRNYIFVKTLGIKVKHQKEGAFWWNKSNTAVIAAGWEYIAYSQANKPTLPKYYTSLVPKETLVGTGNGQFDYSVIPTQIEILKTPTFMGETYIPLIVGNDLPIPLTIRNKGPQGIIDYLWRIIQKKIKTGDVILKDNNGSHPVHPTDQVDSWKTKTIIFRDYTNTKYIFFPPYMQFAYNTDMIDIGLDSYTADFTSLIPIVVNAINDPEKAGQQLGDWAKQEMGNSFKVKQAVVFGSSQKNGIWRGVRIIHNDPIYTAK